MATRKVQVEITAEDKASSKLGQFKTLLTGLVGAMVVKQIAQVGIELMKLGAQAEQMGKTFAALGGTAAGLDELSAATRGMVSDMDAMAAANQLMVMGLAENTTEAAKLAEMATQLGSAMGHDATQSMGDFALMLANQSILRLDTFGISSGRVKVRIEELMAATKGMTREAAFTAATMEEGAKAMARVGEQAGGTAGQLGTMAAQTENIKMLFGEIVAGAFASTGVIETLNKGLMGLSDWLRQGKSIGQPWAEAKASIEAAGVAGILTAEQTKAYMATLWTLGGDLKRGRIDQDAYTEGLAAIQAGLAGVAAQREMAGAGLEQELAGMRALRAEAEQAAALPDTAALLEAENAAIIASLQNMSGGVIIEIDAIGRMFAGIPTAADQAFNELEKSVADFSSSFNFSELAATFAQHGTDMLKITEGGVKRREEVTFKHQLELVKAQAKYQTEHAALVAAGDTEAAANLTAKFDAQTAETGAGYQAQLAEAEYGLAVQRIAEQESYIASLTMQQDAMVRKLYMMTMEAATADGIVSAREQGLLDVIKTGASEQLKAEIKKGEQLAQIQKDIASGSIETAGVAAAAMIQIYAGEVGAANTALDELERLRGVAMDKMLAASQQAVASGLGAGLTTAAKSVSSGAKKVSESATKSLSDVQKDITKGIEEASKAMEKLPGMLWTPAMEAGLEQVGKAVRAGVKAVYSWIAGEDGEEGIGKELKKVQDYIAPISDLLSLFGSSLDMKTVAGDYGARLTKWISQWRQAVGTLFAQIQGISAEARLALPAATETVESINGILEMLSLSLDVSIVENRPEFADRLGAWIGVWRIAVGQLSLQLTAIEPEVRASLTAVAGVTDSIREIVEMLEIKMDVAGVQGREAFADRLLQWIGVWRIAVGQLYTQLIGIDAEVRAALPVAAETLQHVEDIVKMLTIKLDVGTVPDRDVFVGELQRWIGVWRIAVGQLYTQLIGIDAEVRATFPAATAAAESIAKILGMLSSSLVVAAVPERFGFFDRLQRWIGVWRIAVGGLYTQLDSIAPEAKAGLPLAADLAEHITKILGLLTTSLEVKLPGVNFKARLAIYLDNLQIALTDTVKTLETIALTLKPDVAALQATFAGSIGEILDLLRLGDLFQEMTEVKYSENVAALVPFRFAVTKIVEDLRWAIEYMVPKLKILKNDWEEGLEEVKGIAALIAEVFASLASATQSANTLLGEQALNPANLTAALERYAAAGGALGEFALMAPGAPGPGATETPRLQGTVNLHIIREDTGEDYVTQLDLAESMDTLLAELWVRA